MSTTSVNFPAGSEPFRETEAKTQPDSKARTIFRYGAPIIAAVLALFPFLKQEKPSKELQNLEIYLKNMDTMDNVPNHVVHRDVINLMNAAIYASQAAQEQGGSMSEVVTEAGGDYGEMRAKAFARLKDMVADLTAKTPSPFPPGISADQEELILSSREDPGETLRIARILMDKMGINEKDVGITDEALSTMYENGLIACFASWQKEQPDFPFSQSDFCDDFTKNMAEFLEANPDLGFDDVLASHGFSFDSHSTDVLRMKVSQQLAELIVQRGGRQPSPDQVSMQ